MDSSGFRRILVNTSSEESCQYRLKVLEFESPTENQSGDQDVEGGDFVPLNQMEGFLHEAVNSYHVIEQFLVNGNIR